MQWSKPPIGVFTIPEGRISLADRTEERGDRDRLAPGFFRAIVDSSVNPFVALDGSGIVVYVGDEIETLLGSPPAAYVGRSFIDVIAPESRGDAIAAYSDFTDPDRPEAPWLGPGMPMVLLGRDGERVPCDISATRPPDTGVMVLQIRRARGSHLLDEAVDAILGGAPLEQALRDIVGLIDHDVPGSCTSIAIGWDGRWFSDVVASADAPPASRWMAATPSEDMPWYQAMVRREAVGEADFAGAAAGLRALGEDHGFATCWAVPVMARGDGDRVDGVLILWRRDRGPARTLHIAGTQRAAHLASLAIRFRDVQESWEREARTDDLTGVANRAALLEHLDTVLSPFPAFRSTAVLYCDLDGFKPVNDQHGHSVGDQVLSIVAQRFHANVRPGDLVARVGGDELAVACRVTHGVEAVTDIADRLIAAVNQPVLVDGREIRVGLSIGVAGTDEAMDARDLLDAADEALLTAKSSGKNRWVLRELSVPVAGSPADDPVH
jgi:diguanylate cyclase (GGDEF)-like protein